MEPLTYFNGQVVVILCYIYFLMTNRDFGYQEHFSKVAQKQRSNLMRRVKFDEARYRHLRHELLRWQRYTRSLGGRV